MPRHDPEDPDDDIHRLAKRVDKMAMPELSQRITALDARHAPPCQDDSARHAALDTSEAGVLLRALKDYDADGECAHAGPLRSAVAAREAALETLVHETRLKLDARGKPDLIAQGLRRLAEAAYEEKEFDLSPCAGLPQEDQDTLLSLLGAFDGELAALQAGARALLSTELRLELMSDQAGETIDATRHKVAASETCDDPASDNTVARQEAPGWLLEGAVIVQADVVRYAYSAGGLPRLPELKDLRARPIDDGLFGRKRET